MRKRRWSMKKNQFVIREDGSKATMVTRLPDDWRLTPNATRQRTLWQAGTKEGQAIERMKQKAARARRRKKK